MQETFHGERVKVSVDAHGVAEVALARPDKMNALDAAMFEALGAAIDQLAGLSDVRAVVLHGEGRAFCAGIDLDSLAPLAQHGELPAHLQQLAQRTHGDCNLYQHVVMGWRALGVPVIAALHGATFGGGLQLALGADVRLVAADTRLSVMEIRWGLVPDMAGCLLLPRLLRDDVARELVFTGRIVAAEEAVQVGLATRLCGDPLAEARAMAQQCAGHPPQALRAGKQLLNLAQRAEAAEVLLAEATAQQALLASPALRALLQGGRSTG